MRRKTKVFLLLGKEKNMTSVVLFVDEPNDVSSVPLTDHVLETECQRRGVHFCYLTLMSHLQNPCVEFFRDLHETMSEPMIDSFGKGHEVEDELALRFLWWSFEAMNHIELFNAKDLAKMERSADEIFGNQMPFTQERFNLLVNTLYTTPP